MVKTKVDLKGEGNMTRDDYSKMKYVLNIASKWYRKKYQQYSCDTTSVNMWIQEHHECVFFNQEASAAADTCFTLGIQNRWQQKKSVTLVTRLLLRATQHLVQISTN